MKAARLEDGVLHIRDLPTCPSRATRRRWSTSARPECATPTSIIARGDWPGVPRNGTIGHEAIGIVEALGPGRRTVRRRSATA